MHKVNTEIIDKTNEVAKQIDEYTDLTDEMDGVNVRSRLQKVSKTRVQ